MEWDRIGVFGGEEEGGGVRSRPGAARTILLFHTISVRPSKQPQIMEYVPSPKVFDVWFTKFVSGKNNKQHDQSNRTL